MGFCPQKIKDSRNINIFNSSFKLWKPEICKLYLPENGLLSNDIPYYIFVCLIDFIIYMYLFFLHEIFISMFAFAQVKVVTAFATIEYCRI